MRRSAIAAGAVTIAVLLSGCGERFDAPTGAAGATSPAPAASRTAVLPEETERPVVEPTDLPPGDPGLDAPGVPEPEVHEDDHGHGPARATVPAEALMTAETVEMVLGGRWTEHPGGQDECLTPEGALGTRSRSYGTSDALVVETVATYPDDEAADAAVAALGRRADRCGWVPAQDPRLGSASTAVSDGARGAVAMAAEGVVVLLVGTGSLTRDQGGWWSLADLALGTSCPAAPDGCH